MSQENGQTRKSITESPWYWIYVFATAGLIALVLFGPKYAQRQSQLERNYQGRVRANQRAAGQEMSTPISTPDQTIISLKPYYWLLGGTVVVAWAVLWWTHFRRPISADSPRREERDQNNVVA